MTGRPSIEKYLADMTSAARGHSAYFPLDKELRLRNCKKLARDIGFGLRDYPLKKRYHFLQCAYGAIFVANCLDSTGVPFSMKEMQAEAKSQWPDLEKDHPARCK